MKLVFLVRQLLLPLLVPSILLYAACCDNRCGTSFIPFQHKDGF